MNKSSQTPIINTQDIKQRLLNERERLHQSELPAIHDTDDRFDLKVDKPLNPDEKIDPVELETDIAIQDRILESIAQIDQAIIRLEEGNYGICTDCGESIPAARLKAFPAALRCIECKQFYEAETI